MEQQNIFKITREQYDDWKKSFQSQEDMNKCVYFVLMKLNNDYNFVKRDFDNCVKWSSIVYDKKNECFSNNFWIFKSIMIANSNTKLFRLCCYFDIFMKQQYKENNMIYINKYGFENNKELMNEYDITDRFETYDNLIKDIFDNKDNMFDNFCESIDWNLFKINDNYDYLTEKCIHNISNNEKTKFYVLRLGKMNDFIKDNYRKKRTIEKKSPRKNTDNINLYHGGINMD